MALKILLADDNITAQKMGAKILTDAGHAVVAVSNGAAAMKKIVAEKPELLILDIYMPGYTGLEVCEKVKSAPETARLPVLLTVTNMEPFKAEDGNRVKADGVLVKPFEATDVLAVVHKLEEKLHAPGAQGYAAPKIAAVKEFEDESYAEWKAEAAPEEEVKAPEMSHEVGSAPLLGIEHLEAGEAPAFAVEAGPAPFTTAHVAVPAFDLNPRSPVPESPAPELDHAEPQVAETAPVIAPPEELEFTSAPPTGAMEVPLAAELEVTEQEAAPDVSIAQDPALVTDPSDVAQFATKFGAEHPEDLPIGIAMQQPPEEIEAPIPAPVIEPAAAEPQSPVWSDSDARRTLGFSAGTGMGAAPAPALETEAAPEAIVDTQPRDVMTEPAAALGAEDPDVRQAPEFSAETMAAPAPALETETAPEVDLDTQPHVLAEPQAEPEVEVEEMPAEPEPHAESAEVTQKLVAQFVAELERAQAEAPPEAAPQPEMEPPAAAATAVAIPDEERVAEAVNRVLERYKGELIAAVVRELKG